MAFSLTSDIIYFMTRRGTILKAFLLFSIIVNYLNTAQPALAQQQPGTADPGSAITGQEQLSSEFNSLYEQYLISNGRERLDIIMEAEKKSENGLFFRKLHELVFMERDYGGSAESLESYAIITCAVLSSLAGRPAGIASFSMENLIASVDFLASYGYPRGYSELYKIRSVKFQAQFQSGSSGSIMVSEWGKLKAAAESAMSAYSGSRYLNLLSVVIRNPLSDVNEAVSSIPSDIRLGAVEKGKLYESVMKRVLEYKTSDHREASIISSLQLFCVRQFASLGWSDATPQVIIYFDQLLSYRNISVVKLQILETVRCLGSLMTIEAVLRLNMYLGVINSYAENNLQYDRDILTAVIRSLGSLGNMAAYENLSDVRKLPYPEEIIREADSALSLLKIGKK